MPELLQTSKAHGFFLADLFGRYDTLTEFEPSNAFKNCRSLQDVILELSKIFNGLNTSRNIMDLKKKLQLSLKKEISEFECTPYLSYFTDYYTIQLIFSLLEDKKSIDVSRENESHPIQKRIIEDEIGYFEELKCIELCKNFQEFKSFVLKYSGVEKFFEVEIKINFKENDFEKIYLQVMKNYYEYYAKLLNKKVISGYFEEILYEEIGFFIMEVVLNSQRNLEDFKIDKKIKEFLPLNYNKIVPIDRINSLEDMKAVFDISNQNIHDGIVERQKRIYSRSFGLFGDLSTVYCYLKLREIQINEIIFEVSKILNQEDHENDEDRD